MEHRTTAGKFLSIWGMGLFIRVAEQFYDITDSIETAIGTMNPFIDPADKLQVETLVAMFECRGWSLGSLMLSELTSGSATMIVRSFEPSEEKDAVIAGLDAIKSTFCGANVQSGHFTNSGFLWIPQTPSSIDPNPLPPPSWASYRRIGPDMIVKPGRHWGSTGGSSPRPVETWEDCADHNHGG